MKVFFLENDWKTEIVLVLFRLLKLIFEVSIEFRKEGMRDMLEINLTMYHAVAVGAAMYFLGTLICNKVAFLNRCCIPAPLVGGLCFCIVNCALYLSGTAAITMDSTLEKVFMNMFFTTVGFTVSIPALLKGGRSVIVCLLIASVMIPLQNFLGGGIMAVFDRSPLYGIACGAIALVGGPGTAAAYGPELVAAGAAGADVAGMAAATFGLIAGSVMGGPTARMLIEKHKLKCPHLANGGSAADAEEEGFETNGGRMVKGLMILLLATGIGTQVSVILTDICNMAFPGYIGGMLTAVVIRNVMDAAKMEYPDAELETMGNMFLSIFLAMNLSALKLWLLIDLALPMIITLFAQCVLMFIFSYFVVFNIMGRDYDAAVMTAGFIGFSMGATSNAMASMDVVSRKYGPSPVAYFAIPMVGGMFIDFVNAIVNTAMISMWAIT